MTTENLRSVTLLFLVKRSGGTISEICLAMKKRGFGVGRLNGVGGKLEPGETIEAAAKREALEEIGVAVGNLDKVAELSFYFSHNPSWDQKVHVYLCEEWKGEPTESEEMNPAWHALHAIPFDAMWPDDKFWLPSVLEGKRVVGSFTFGENDIILKQNVKIVPGF